MRVEKCACGRRRSKFQSECSRCFMVRMQNLQDGAKAVVSAGKCPQCGNPLERNLALPGWYQCVAFPSISMRKEQYRDLQKCGFQCFTE